MQGTALLLLIITVLLNIYIAAYFTVEKKILRTLDVRQQEKREKKYKKVDVAGTVTSTFDRDRSLLRSMCKIFPSHRY